MKELPVPPVVRTDTRARELARVWAAHGEQHVSLDVSAWPDPGAWGLLLVDLAHHVANAYADSQGLDASEVLVRIREAFEVEMDCPTGTSSNDD
ncbi:MAG TPA: DUF5076 domain-containing protein [Polyangium sp.]|nr:DUF5076 domain-containing protein [Polyangium sp.]